jgi:hypothetical protein
MRALTSFRTVAALFACVAMGAVAGCATREASEPVEPIQMVYTPPSGEPGAMSTILRNGDAEQWLDRASTNLRNLGFTVTHVDPIGGFVAATRSMQPRDWVDCGWIVEAGATGSREMHDASESDLEVDIYNDGRLIRAKRTTALDTRVVVVARQLSDDRTELTSRVSYAVVRKTRGPGAVQNVSEVIHFGSGESASFEKGTICQPTGALERTVLADL